MISPGVSRTNPFDTEAGRANSSYAAFENGRLRLALTPCVPPSALQEHVHASFRALVLNPSFVCVGAKSAVRRGSYRMGLYGDLATDASTAGLAHDLFAFVDEHGESAPMFTSFAAVFTGPELPDEKQFERLVWCQLQALHDRDWRHHPWDQSVSSDPEDASFSFSFAGQAFFVVGLHPVSSRLSRRFEWPTLIFNRHDQFERLREDGRYTAIQAAIRARDRALQGDPNPMVHDFGTISEARQYSGRAVDEGWRCPFQPHTTDGMERPEAVGDD